MKVYYQGASQKHTLYVSPGTDFPETSAFMENGKPKMYEVKFINNVAEVEDNLGQYLIDKGFATKSVSRIIQRVSKKLKEAIL